MFDITIKAITLSTKNIITKSTKPNPLSDPVADFGGFFMIEHNVLI